MKYVKVILAAIALIASTSASRADGKCGEGLGECPTGTCCSQYGYCGTTKDHCGVGCQPAFGYCLKQTTTTTTAAKKTTNKKKVVTTTTTKKANKKKTTTKKGDKKKKNTTTTTTTKKSTPTNSKKISTNGQCGPKYGSCPDDHCCSKYGYCGISDAHCGKGCQSEFGRCGKETSEKKTTTTTTTVVKKTTTTKKSKPTSSKKISTNGQCGAEFGSCPDGQCCSQYGYCGFSEEHCDKGCQSEFGACGKDVVEKNTVKGFKYYDHCVNKKHWALTFDDGPYSYDLHLLDLLKKYNVKATFFINGANVMDIKTDEAKKIIQRMNADGHIVASHTWSHSDISAISKKELIKEMTQLEDWIYKYIGKKPALMRPPYGAGNGNVEVAKTLKSLGYNGACMWNVDTLDWDRRGIDYALGEFKKGIENGKGILSLNHSFYQKITKSSLLDLIEAEIKLMKSKGYTPVTIDKCLELKAYQ